MAEFYVSLADGVYETSNPGEVQKIGIFTRDQGHQMAFDVRSSAPVTTGMITVRAKAVGSKVFEDVPNGVINLANPQTLQFLFIASELQFTLSGADQDGRLRITDTQFSRD